MTTPRQYEPGRDQIENRDQPAHIRAEMPISKPPPGRSKLLSLTLVAISAIVIVIALMFLAGL